MVVVGVQDKVAAYPGIAGTQGCIRLEDQGTNAGQPAVPFQWQ
jgi:hypothetical protein